MFTRSHSSALQQCDQIQIRNNWKEGLMCSFCTLSFRTRLSQPTAAGWKTIWDNASVKSWISNICSCLNFTVESCRCTSATQRLLDNTNIGDANSASLTSWIKDMTANTEEVKGQSACFSHLINPAAAPDSSVLSVLEGGDCAWLTGTNRRSEELQNQNLQVLIYTMEKSYMLIINFLAS